MKKIILIFLGLINLFECYTQDLSPMPLDRLKPQTPMAAQFYRFDEMPITEYIGIPNINIQFHTIKLDNVEIPINLTYHSNGIKVNQEASWIGLGWDLQIPTLTQIVNSQDDLYNEWETSKWSKRRKIDWWPGTFPVSYLFWPQICDNHIYEALCTKDKTVNIFNPDLRHTYLISTDYFFPINGQMTKCNNDYDGIGMPNSHTDTSPDIFKVNIQGKTITFISDFSSTNKNKFILLNSGGYKINLDVLNKTWHIIDPDGNQYYFSDNTETIVTPQSGTSSTSNRIWMLNKVITSTNKIIQLKYIKNNNPVTSYTLSHSFGEQIKFDMNYWLSPRYGHTTAFTSTSYVRNGIDSDYSLSKECQLYLEKIIFPLGYINFTHSNREDISNANRLSSIVMYNNKNELIKKFSLKHDYFVEQDGKAKRLKLVGIDENSTSNYNFKYDSTTLPNRNSYSQDYWGYYNGHPNKSLIPNPKRFAKNKIILDNKEYEIIHKDIINNNMSANLKYIQAGILKEITYPTGGKVSFDYELNEFNKFAYDNNSYTVPNYEVSCLPNNGPSKGLGLRIKAITYKDYNNDTIKQTKYTYDGGMPLNIIKNQMRLFNRDICPGGNSSYVQKFKYFYITTGGYQSINPLASFNGVGYTFVRKEQIDYNDNTNNGYIETTYNNNPDKIAYEADISNAQTYYSVPSFKDWSNPENGTPDVIKIYDQNKRLIKEENFKYENVKSKIYYGALVHNYSPQILFTSSSAINNNQGYFECIDRHLVNFFPIIDYESLLKQKLIYEYIGKDTIVNVEQYAYIEDLRLIKTKDLSNSLNNKKTYQLFYYSYAFETYSIYTEPKGVYKEMKDRNILTPINSISEYKGDAKISYSTEYDIYNNLILPKNNSIRYGYTSDFLSNYEYHNYDTYGNPLYITKNDAVKVVYLWSYAGQYPIAEIKNATYDQVKAYIDIEALSKKSEPSESDIKSIQNLQTIIKDIMVTTYTYKPLVGITSMTDPSGVVTYYNYDSFGRLKESYYYENGDTSKKRIIQSYEYNYQNQ